MKNEPPRVGLGVLVWKNGTFCILKRRGSHGASTWGLPGGHLEFGESWQACAARETMEETGMEIANVRFLAATNDIFANDGKHYITIWVEADWAAGEAAIKEPHRATDLRWATFATLPSPLFDPCWANLRLARPELFSQPN